MDEIIVVNLAPDHFAALEQLQRDCYPTLGESELMKVEQFASQYRIFAQGQFVALAGHCVVGQGSGFFTDFDFEQPAHTFREICAEFFFTRHDPNGAYYYGADISVHPAYRGRGIGKMLYAARMELVKRSNRRGIVGGGVLPGYITYKQSMSVQEYVAKVVSGALSDPTLSFQLASGFRVRGLLQNYLEDSASDNWAVLIEWVNPDYQPQ